MEMTKAQENLQNFMKATGARLEEPGKENFIVTNCRKCGKDFIQKKGTNKYMNCKNCNSVIQL